MVAANLDIVIEKGAVFNPSMVLKTKSTGAIINLTGYTAKMQCRETIGAATAFVDLTTENDGINITGSTGLLALYISPEDTAAITATKGFYDLYLIPPSGDDIRLLQGKVTVSPTVTP